MLFESQTRLDIVIPLLEPLDTTADGWPLVRDEI